MLYATKQSKVTKNYLLFASNRLEQPMNTANHAFSPATPIDHTYQCHVLFPLRRLDLKMGNGRQVIKSVSTFKHTRNWGRGYALQLIQRTRLGIPHSAINGCHGARGMCSKEL